MATANIFDSLKADHDRHRAMLVAIEEAAGDKAERDELFEAFRVDVTGHAAAEEQTLYATMMADPELQEDARHSVSEHKELDDMIVRLCELTTDGAAWRETFAELRTEYDHHITEEEEEMFPAAAARLSDADEVRLARVFEARKPAEAAKAAATDPAEKESRD